MNVYADQNFLIYCAQNQAWWKKVKEANESGSVSLVLSPWHFYEFGRGATHANADELLKLAEEVQPKWIIERADLQLFEFWIVWRQVFESLADAVEPIGTFGEIAAVLSKVDEHHLQGVTMRDYVRTFSEVDAIAEVEKALAEHRNVTQSIRAEYLSRMSDKATQREMELTHLALQLARLELKAKGTDRVWRRAKELLREEPIHTKMEFFISSGLMRELKCHATEVGFAEELLMSGAVLDVNRFVDRQHASVALPYCDRFITDDADLRKRCARIAARLPFPLAEVMTGRDFLRNLG